MSYQKHHAPSQQVIQEDEECSEDLKVIRPLLGIESNKHQPIIRANRGLNISITPHEASQIHYNQHHYNVHQKILDQFRPKKVSSKLQFSKNTQTAFSQTTTQYPSTSSGQSTKFFSLKNTKKVALNGNAGDNPKK